MELFQVQEIDAIAISLCQPLLLFLKSRPLLNSSPAMEYLLQTKTEIEESLHIMRQQLTEVNAVDQQLLVGRGGEAMSEVQSDPWVTSPYPLSSTTTSVRSPLGVRRTKRSSSCWPSAKKLEPQGVATHTKNVKVMNADSKGARHEDIRIEAKRRGKKRRTLIALHPYRELTEEESSTTVMMKLLGQKFVEGWFRWKKYLQIVTWIALLSGVTSIAAAIFWVDFTETTRLLVCTLIVIPCLAFVTLQNLAMMNFTIFMTSLWTFDALFFIAETCLFSFALWGGRCFTSASAFLSSTCIFIGISTFSLFYDSVSVSARKRWFNVALVSNCLFFTFILFLLYTLPSKCPYRLDFTRGLLLENDSRMTRWSISLKEFCLNRGLTLLMLQLKIIYSAYKHPQDCVILKSRVRAVDRVIRESPAKDKQCQKADIVTSNLITTSHGERKNGQ